MTVRVGINGFGRIGRNFFRAAKAQGADIDFVAVNDLGDMATMAHLLKYDTMHGIIDADVTLADDGIVVDGDKLQVLSQRDPSSLPWGDLGVDVVIESTGVFKTRALAAQHLDAGAPFVIISAPCGDADKTFVMGVNDDAFDADVHKVVSNASCTTNCLAPMVKVLKDNFGLEQGLLTTIHAYTGTQNLVDGPHKDLRRSRAAAVNIIPTSTGAAKTTGLVLEDIDGDIDGIAMRVPVAAGSITEFTCNVGRHVTAEEVNAAFKDAATSGPLSKVLVYTEDPLVSSDIVGTAASVTFDSGMTRTIRNLVKINGWYDNEMGYSSRLVDLAQVMGAATR